MSKGRSEIDNANKNQNCFSQNTVNCFSQNTAPDVLYGTSVRKKKIKTLLQSLSVNFQVKEKTINRRNRFQGRSLASLKKIKLIAFMAIVLRKNLLYILIFLKN